MKNKSYIYKELNPLIMTHPLSTLSIINLLDHFNDTTITPKTSSYWASYLKTGSYLWLDTGDIEAALKIWTPDFSALTTNNTLLNNEIQKGVYDEIIPIIATKISFLCEHDQIKEIAFCLNAIHGLRLVKLFNAQVSVELHTDLAHDIAGIIDTGRRLHQCAPNHFIIKVPFTAAGLIAARQLKNKGIPVNFTLDFSVRQNAFSSVVAQPMYTNVFLGRLGAYLSSNQLGEGKYIGEKVTLETQHCLRILNRKGLTQTRLIAASIRNSDQLNHLAGTDVFTIPVKIAEDALKSNIVPEKSHINDIPELDLYDNEAINRLHLKKLWQVRHHEIQTILHLTDKLPETGQELEEYAREHGCRDLFPILSKEEHQLLKQDGKIPNHARWENKIVAGEIAIDTLLNLAGLYSFETDQQQLDLRIKGILKANITEKDHS